MDEIDHLAGLARSSRDLTTEALRRLVTRRGMTDPERRETVQRLLEHADPTAVPHPQLRIIERHQLSVRRGISFRAIMLQRSEAAKHVGVRDRAWLLDDKVVGYRFADALGVRRPAGDLTPRPLAELTLQPPCAVKPVRATGSRGVYLVYKPDRIVEVRTNEVLRSWDEMVERCRALVDNPLRPVADQWIVEELVLDGGEPARDLKFYCAYGEVLFVSEIVRLPTPRRSTWSPDRRLLEVGKPNTLGRGARGVGRDQVALAARISAEIPSPFMRIDALRLGRKELVINEFTPRPGQFEEFSPEYDRLLGEAWVRAERRLLDDALAGKRFRAWAQAVGDRDPSTAGGLDR